MDRRRFLAVAGTSLVAGCPSSEPETDPTPPPTATPGGTPTETPTPTATRAPTPPPASAVTFLDCYTVRVDAERYDQVTLILLDGSTQVFDAGYDSPREFSAEGEAAIEEAVVFVDGGGTNVLNPDTESCGPEPTPTPEGSNEHLDTGHDHLVSSFEAYEASGDAGDFHDVHGGVTVSEGRVRDSLYLARDELDKAEGDDLDSEQQERLADLRSVHWFFWWLPTVHQPLQQAKNEVNGAWESFKIDRTSDWDDRLDEAGRHATGASHGLEDVENDSYSASMDSFGPLTADDYDKKVSDLRSAIGQADAFHSRVNTLDSEAVQLGRAIDDYQAERYDQALDRLDSIVRILDSLYTEVADIEWRPSVATIGEELTCVAEALSEGSAQLEEAAVAGADGLSETRSRREEEACNTLQSCDLSIEIVPEIEDLCS